MKDKDNRDSLSNSFRGGYSESPSETINKESLDSFNFRFSDIYVDDIVNGEGVGVVLFTQFCSHMCKGCHNSSTWSKNGGKKFTQDSFDFIFDYFKDTPYASRLTLSGGDPLENLQLSNYVASEFKRMYPNKKLGVYTGYTYEQIKDEIKYMPILELCDVLVDGKFELDKRDIKLKYKGSSNQRVIDVQESLKQNKVILYN